jgi:ubiquinone/menaquinone biosynthesis C-methylase UbiE
MTVTSQVEEQTVLAFDSLAARYDDLFTHSMIGRAQRGAVWKALVDRFEPGAQILELNCGTGEDALFLAQREVSVLACDASEAMIKTARQRMQSENPSAQIQFKLLPTEHLSKLRPEQRFDGALSNFSGLNCVADLHQTARDLAALVKVGAPVLICISTRFCLTETLWFLLHGRGRKALRRASGMATAKVGGFTVKVHYPTLRGLKQIFAPYFSLRSCTGIGVAVPPSYLEPWVRKYPRVLSVLCLIDKAIARLPWLRTVGDHMLIHFERVEE